MKYLAAGDRSGEAQIFVWNVSNAKLKAKLSEGGHTQGVSCVRFCKEKFLISVGFRNDRRINVWDIDTQSIVACNSTSSKVYNISVCKNSFVSVGEKHLM